MARKSRKKDPDMSGHTNVHHIVPISRRGTGRINNITEVPIRAHSRYHSLFSNLKPDEIIIFLTEKFWNGQKDWVWEALQKLEDKET